MSITKSEIQTIVERVVSSMGKEPKSVFESPPEDTGQMGVFSDMEKAINAAQRAHYELVEMTLTC